MNSFDLNIKNYSELELAEMFGLPMDYDINMIEIRETLLRNQVAKSLELAPQGKEDTLKFISKAKTILVNFFRENNQKQNAAELTKLTYNIHDGTLPKTDTIVQGSHMVQQEKTVPFANSFPGEFYPGVLNPLKKKTSRLNLNIDTRFRENYFGTLSTNFNLTLPMNLTNILSLQLSAIEIPLNFYVVSRAANNYFFTILVNEEKQVIFIPDGNYTIAGVLSVINTELDSFGAPFNGIFFQQDLVNGSGSNQILVGIKDTYIGTDITSLSLDFQANKEGGQDRSTPLPLKFGWLLGFRNGYYENSLAYVSEGIPDFSGPKYVYLAIDDFNNNVNNGFYSAFNSSLLNNNILARISVQSKGLYTTYTENNSNIVTYPRQYFGPVNIYNMQIQLLDEYGRILNLNNTDYSFCLTMQMVYDL